MPTGQQAENGRTIGPQSLGKHLFPLQKPSLFSKSVKQQADSPRLYTTDRFFFHPEALLIKFEES